MKKSAFYKTKWFRSLAIFIFVVSCLFFLGERIWANWEDLKLAISRMQSQYLWLSLLMLTASFLLRPVGFHIFFKVSSYNVGYVDNFNATFLSQLAKYLPGGVWVYASRVIVYKTAGVDVGMSSLGLVFESITMVLSSMITGSILFWGNFPPIPEISGIQWIILAASCVGGSVFLLYPQIVERIFPYLFRKVPYLKEFYQLGFNRRLVALGSTIVVFVFMWGLAGMSFYFLIKGFDPGVSIGILTSIGVFSISWLVGFISIFNPGGVGIREAIIVLLLGVYVLEPIPLLVAITSRIFWSFLELFFALIAWGLQKWLR